MKIHVLKTLPEFFDAIHRGDKNFEVRYNDRNFQVGDILVLRQFTADTAARPHQDLFTLFRRVTYLLPGSEFGVHSDYVVMAIRPLTPEERDAMYTQLNPS